MAVVPADCPVLVGRLLGVWVGRSTSGFADGDLVGLVRGLLAATGAGAYQNDGDRQ
jgi:hypothetical protein